MLAASALHSTAKAAAPFGDPVAAPGAKTGDDGFSGALAALMSVLGPPAPVTATTSSPSSGGDSAGGGGTSAGAAPSAESPTAATSSVAATSDPASSNAADASATVPAPGADPGAAGAPLSPDLLLALPVTTAGVAQAANAADPAAATALTQAAADATAGAAATIPSTPAMDPRLVRFVAKPQTPGAAQGGPDATGSTAQAAVTLQSAAPTSDPSAGAGQGADPTSSQTPAPATAAAAAPPISGLVLQATPQPTPTNATGQPASDRAKSIKTAVQSQAASALTTAAKPDVAVEGKATIAATAGARDDAALSLNNEDAARQGAQAGDTSADNSSSTSFVASPTNVAGGPQPQAATGAPPPAALASAHGAEITAQLAAQITSKVGAARTAFDFALEPQGLGRVDVSLKIDPQGQLSAVLSFDNPNAAAEAKSRAGELQQALQQAGLDVGQSGLSFTFSGGHGQSAAWQGQSPLAYAAPSADVAPDPAATASAATAARSAGGLDITI